MTWVHPVVSFPQKTLSQPLDNIFSKFWKGVFIIEKKKSPYYSSSRVYTAGWTGRTGSSEVPRNPLTRWDVSSIPANGIFLTKTRNNKNKKGNGQKRELPVLFGQKRMYPENNSGRECCWPYLIGQRPLSPVFGQKRPGTPGNSYFAQLPPVFGHFMFLSGGLLECWNRSTWATRTINSKSLTS